jgi:hypothetical protein
MVRAVSRRDSVDQVTQPPTRKAAFAQYFIATGLGVIAVGGTVVLAATDAIRGSATWPHHSPASAAPLFLIAAAIAAVSIGTRPKGRHALLRVVAILAFTAWGIAQLVSGPAARALNDAAIVLFVIDGGYLVITEARAILIRHSQPAKPDPPRRDPADAPAHTLSKPAQLPGSTQNGQLLPSSISRTAASDACRKRHICALNWEPPISVRDAGELRLAFAPDAPGGAG